MRRDLAVGQEDDYTTGYLLDYNYFKKYKMIVIDLSKPQALDVDPKAIKQINFAGNLNQGVSANDNTTLFIAEQAKQAILDFSQRTMEVS